MLEFGDAAKAHWTLEEDMVFLNHGSYGATPRPVLEMQDAWRRRMEAQPCQFMNAVLPGALREAAAPLARFIGARQQDVAFVENATSGVNAIVRSMRFCDGDEVVVTDHVYNAVRNALRFVLDAQEARLVVTMVPLPVRRDELADQVMDAVTPRTRLIVIDHIASLSAVIFPVAEIAARAAQRGIPVLVDGAHAPGMVDLDVHTVGAAWYVGNCHKWLCAPKGAAFLWAAPQWQDGLHPTVISHDLGRGFTAEFDRVGTRDASAWLSVPAAIGFHNDLGGAALRRRNHEVAVTCGAALAAGWGTQMGGPPEVFGSMVTVRAPAGLPAERKSADALKAWLWQNRRIEVHAMPFGGALWIRLSVATYTTEAECMSLADAVPEAIAALTARAT